MRASIGVLTSMIFFCLSLGGLSAFAKPKIGDPEVTNIWPSIPFLRGQDICKFKGAYSQTRQEYIQDMVGLTTKIMEEGGKTLEAAIALSMFNELYDKNQTRAVPPGSKEMDVTLESTLKASVNNLYRQIPVAKRKISFKNVNDILSMVRNVSNGQREGYLDYKILRKLDYVGYGTFSLAPDCAGDVLVTLHLVGRKDSREYVAQGPVESVMSQIAQQMFQDFQATSFPSTVDMGEGKKLNLVGALNGSINVADTPTAAARACRVKGARLPTEDEMQVLHAMGSWSGGVSMRGEYGEGPEHTNQGHFIWAITEDRALEDELHRFKLLYPGDWFGMGYTFSYFCVK